MAKKELFIVRHGKSSWDHADISDIDRPLKERGINDGYMMAQRLLTKKLVPTKILSSPANRALHSATIFARVLQHPYQNIDIEEDIYFADQLTMLNLIKQTSNQFESLMVFGHNPTFTDLANHFLTSKIDNIPTTGIVWLKFESDSWQEIDKNKPLEHFFDYPKNMK
ncbi:MAG: histidine phosphatase family protein [Bacteroidales bacterium]